ncbi:MAG TPA: 50S ribosomal protein L9 [Negativicutes bacterium]|nr:50S ribosomal protein L9 [Negativicutes bacterium]
MKVILLQDVKKLGAKGETMEVAEGYARNFLLPRKLAAQATADTMNQLQQQKNAMADRQKRQLEEAKLLAAQLGKIEIKVTAKAGEGGKLFGAVTTKDIVDAAKVQHGLELDRRKMEFTEPIKNLGSAAVVMKIHPEVTAEIKVQVIGE